MLARPGPGQMCPQVCTLHGSPLSLFVAFWPSRWNASTADSKNGTTIAIFRCAGLLFIAENTAMKTIEAPGSSRKRPGPLTSKRRPDCGTEGGQSLVELALVLPLLLLLLVGIIEIGRFSYYSILVANAARAGAQYGAQSVVTAADAAGIRAAAHNDGLPSLAVTPRQLCGCTGATLGACSTIAPTCVLPDHPLVYVQVTATHRFPSLFNYPGLPASLRLTSTEKMRVAQ